MQSRERASSTTRTGVTPLYACDDVVRVADAIEDILELVDSVQERREIANRLDRAASFKVTVDQEITVGKN